MDVSRGSLNMAMAPHRYTSKRIAERWRSNNVITSMGLGSVGFCSVSSESFFVVTCTCLSLVLAFDFCNSQLIFFVSYLKKDTKINISKKTFKYSEKNEFIKERWGGPTFKLRRGSGVLLLKFEGGPGSHF